MGKISEIPIFPIILTESSSDVSVFSIPLQQNYKLLTKFHCRIMANYNLKEHTRQLIAEFCNGNDEAFSQLYDLYVQILFNYGSKLTQDQELLKDCIHDVFIKVYNKRHDKNAINNMASYLIISLKNRLLDEFRRNTFTSEEAAEHYEFRYASDDVERDYLKQERQDVQACCVEHLMQKLTRRQRQAITLYYLEERKYDEICQIMQMNYHSVRNLMHRGMLKLREAAL